MKLDFLRRRNVSPIRYTPGQLVTPPSWRTRPLASSTGRSSHGYEARYPVAQMTVLISPDQQRRVGRDACRLEALRSLGLIVEAAGFGPLVQGAEQAPKLQVGECALVEE